MQIILRQVFQVQIFYNILFHVVFDQLTLIVIVLWRKKSIHKYIHTNTASSFSGSGSGKMDVVSTLQSNLSTTPLVMAPQRWRKW